MLRDYSDEALHKLKDQIVDINQKDYANLFDVVGDAWYYMKSFVGLLDIDNYLDNVSSYHRQVLDQHNTTADELDEIFEEVRELDRTYGNEMWEVERTLKTGAENLSGLAEIINPKADSFNLSAVKVLGAEVRKEVNDATESLQEVFHDAVVKLQLEEAKKSGLETLKDAASIVSTVASFICDVASGNLLKAGLDIYKVCDKFIGFCGDISSFVINGMGLIVTLFPGTERVGLKIYEECNDVSSKNGIVDHVEDLSGIGSKIGTVVRTIDSCTKLLSMGVAIDGILENAGDLSAGKKDVFDIFLDNTGLKYDTGKPYAGDKAFWSNVKWVISMGVAYINGEIGDEIIENTNLGGLAKKEKGIFENLETEVDVHDE